MFKLLISLVLVAVAECSYIGDYKDQHCSYSDWQLQYLADMNIDKSLKTFTLDIKVADVKDAETDGDIYVILKDTLGDTWEHHLDKKNHDDFKRGSTETYSWYTYSFLPIKCFMIENRSDDGLLMTDVDLRSDKGLYIGCRNKHWIDTDDNEYVTCQC